MTNAVSWMLVFHLSGMVMWIGGLFFAMSAAGGAAATESGEAAARRQRAFLAQKAMRRFAHPGAALMVVTGGLLMWLLPYVRMAPWLHAKLTMVVILIVLDLMLTARLRRMPEQEPSRRQMGFFHSAISIAFLFILVMVLVKPF